MFITIKFSYIPIFLLSKRVSNLSGVIEWNMLNFMAIVYVIYYLYIVMSMNRFDTKLWLLLNSLLDCFVQLKEKNVQKYKFVLGFQAQLKMENG